MLPYIYMNVVQGTGSSTTCTTNVPPVEQNSNKSLQFDVNLIKNNSHPLFLHNDDHPEIILIAKKLMGPENYAPWSQSMHIAHSARNKFFIVNGTFQQPNWFCFVCTMRSE